MALRISILRLGLALLAGAWVGTSVSAASASASSAGLPPTVVSSTLGSSSVVSSSVGSSSVVSSAWAPQTEVEHSEAEQAQANQAGAPDNSETLTAVAAPDAAPAGFEHHVVDVPGGRIDWTRGLLWVEGIGRAKGNSPQHKLMAIRAAEMVAARNALAAAAAIRTGGDAYLRPRGGAGRLHGVIQGHRVVSTEWQPQARPPTARVTLEVPLWGTQGVASAAWRTRGMTAGEARPRVALSTQPADRGESSIVVDARGLAFSECLFPTIVDVDGRIVYDLQTASTATTRLSPAVRYVRSERQVEPPGRRAIQVTTVRATDVAGPQGSEFIIAAEAADQLSQSPDTAAAMRAARVYILVGPAPEARQPVVSFE